MASSRAGPSYEAAKAAAVAAAEAAAVAVAEAGAPSLTQQRSMLPESQNPNTAEMEQKAEQPNEATVKPQLSSVPAPALTPVFGFFAGCGFSIGWLRFTGRLMAHPMQSLALAAG
eukprot:gnl/TRDRNA2_/TRDRNA2_73624_c0_seq2.p2 gnl/TRDRNA2_/TRDRNA2_73624_c0~~gnl/TRDRNA2_/TRDRNA2_73624_c0_seq2.p2  ORF type:complete len:115 (+),score=26.53 gnl/TRDRNA2_/TRDRNA2_73624_c0_seq2:3-347(+)